MIGCESALNFDPFRRPSVTPDQPRVLMQIQNIAGCSGGQCSSRLGVKRHADSQLHDTTALGRIPNAERLQLTANRGGTPRRDDPSRTPTPTGTLVG